MWRECLDESSGYPYYWHIETNEVTWEMPEELRYLKNNVKTNSVVKSLSMQESHWVDFSSVACNYISKSYLFFSHQVEFSTKL